MATSEVPRAEEACEAAWKRVQQIPSAYMLTAKDRRAFEIIFRMGFAEGSQWAVDTLAEKVA